MVQASKECSEGQFIICARTDAKRVEGMDKVYIFKYFIVKFQAISRSKAYISAGADMIFPEGLGSLEEFAYVAKELKA